MPWCEYQHVTWVTHTWMNSHSKPHTGSEWDAQTQLTTNQGKPFSAEKQSRSREKDHYVRNFKLLQAKILHINQKTIVFNLEIQSVISISMLPRPILWPLFVLVGRYYIG